MTDKVESSSVPVEQQQQLDLGLKVYVGNLNYKTNEEVLSAHFGPNVKSSIIVRRGEKSFGYGFVDFSSKEEAEVAVKNKNNTELEGRNIRVEIAVGKAARPERPRRRFSRFSRTSENRDGDKPRRPRYLGPRTRTEGDASTSQPREPREPRQPRQPREPGQQREPGQKREPREPREPRQPREGQEGEDRRIRRPRQRAPRRPDTEVAPFEGQGQAPSQQRRRPKTEGTQTRPPGPRPGLRRQRKPRPEGQEPSQTGVFVANIPYRLTDEDFKKIFEDKQLKVAAARIARRPNNMSLGFGFADFSSNDDQKKAIAELNGFVVENRRISVKVEYLSPEPAPQTTQQ